MKNNNNKNTVNRTMIFVLAIAFICCVLDLAASFCNGSNVSISLLGSLAAAATLWIGKRNAKEKAAAAQ